MLDVNRDRVQRKQKQKHNQSEQSKAKHFARICAPSNQTNDAELQSIIKLYSTSIHLNPKRQQPPNKAYQI